MANKYTALPIPPELSTLYASGMTQQEIAQHFGVSQKVVFGWMKRAGITARKAIKRDQRGEKNAFWGGRTAAVSYQAYHCRVIAQRGQPIHCEECGTTDPSKSYDWANMTKQYHDITDYKRLCRSCHWKLDEKILNIKHMRRSSESAASSAE